MKRNTDNTGSEQKNGKHLYNSKVRDSCLYTRFCDSETQNGEKIDIYFYFLDKRVSDLMKIGKPHRSNTLCHYFYLKKRRKDISRKRVIIFYYSVSFLL